MGKANVLAGSFGGLIIGLNLSLMLAYGPANPRFFVSAVALCCGIGLVVMAFRKSK